MKKIILPMRYVGMLAVALTLLSGCRKDLCYNHDEHSLSVKAEVKSTWELVWERPFGMNWEELWKDEWPKAYDDFRPEPGEGIRALIYRGDTYSEHNLKGEGGRLAAPEGESSILFYNNDTEYIVFEDLPSYATATASTRTRSRSGFEDLHAGERTITPPDMLYSCYIPSYIGEKTLTPVELPVWMRPLTYTYTIRYRFKSGLKYVAQARGALAGMAEKVFLQDGHTDGSAATLLFDCKIDDIGVTAVVQSFGIPGFSNTEGVDNRASERHYTLNLEVKLHNNKVKKFDFDVSKAMRIQPRGGALLVDGIEISDDDGQEGSGGFDPDIGDWEDEIDIPLPIN